MSNSSIVTIPKEDPQAEKDLRGIALDQVGISGVHYPIVIDGWGLDAKEQQRTEAVFSLQVSLAAETRGIHMSRLLETLHHWDEPLSLRAIPRFLELLSQQQEAEAADLTCAFTWFVSRPSPQTNKPAWQGIETIFHASKSAESYLVGYSLRIPVTTLCPCSRAISDYGAHSQRGWVTVELEWTNAEDVVAPQEIYEKLQHAGSAPIYPLLKRADERHVTMLAYEQPAFVEDTARRAAQMLREDERLTNFYIGVQNEESIHTHDAVASVSYQRNR